MADKIPSDTHFCLALTHLARADHWNFVRHNRVQVDALGGRVERDPARLLRERARGRRRRRRTLLAARAALLLGCATLGSRDFLSENFRVFQEEEEG